MNATDFQKLVLSEFPALRQDFHDWEGLLHLQVSDFCRFTQDAIEMRSVEVVSRCFEIATTALGEGDDSVKNAIYVSYLEHLDFRSEAGKQAAQCMPPELHKARNDILDYDEQLLGRKRDNDER
jgi:hypothetical protein